MRNILCSVEKKMKNFLKNKRKMKYSKGLVIAFLMTGSFLGFSENKTLQLELKNLRKKIKKDKDQNNKLLYDNELELERLEKEGDQVVKLPWDSYILYTNLFHKHVHRKEKEWKYSSRKNTAQDNIRDGIVPIDGSKIGTTGWITINPGWSNNTSTYDNSSLFSITASLSLKEPPIVKVPHVTPPQITIPVIPTVNIPSPEVKQLTIINQILINAPSVNVGIIAQPNINVIAPNIPSVTSISVQTPLINIPEVSISEKTVTPLEKIPEPQQITATPVVVALPVPLINPSINLPQSKSVLEPNANPFSDFAWDWAAGGIEWVNTNTSSSASLSMAENVNVTGGTFWTGVNPDTGVLGNVAGYRNATQSGSATAFNGSRTYDRRHYSILNYYNGRWVGSTTPQKVTGGTFHVAGGDPTGPSNATGSEAFHLVADVDLQNITVNLYGKAAFINAEAFRGGRTTMSNVKINVLRDNNTIFHLKGQSPGQDASGYAGGQFSTLFSGNADITVDTQTNTAFAVKSYAGGLRLKSDGEIIFNGASNIGVSFFTWVPDKSKYIANQFPNYTAGGLNGEGTLSSYIPYVELNSAKPMKFYGDENVGVFFNKRLSGYEVGIHQGYFKLYFDIGTQLNSNAALTTQDVRGQLSKTGYSAEKVDSNVGIYAISGQRTGVNEDSLSTASYYDLDPIHNLNMDDFNIKFGKYSNNGFMFLAKNGTVVDIKNTASTTFSDGINGASTVEADASQGTVIAYAEGTWTTGGTGLSEKTAGTIEGKPTEIIVGKELAMVSKNGIAFFGKSGGLITANQKAEGLGYGSIIAYADNGTVTMNGEIKAVDRGVATVTEKNKNRGAVAVNGGTINVNKGMTINGVGGFASGTGSTVTLGSLSTSTVNNDAVLAVIGGGIGNVGSGTVINTAAGTDTSGSEKLAFYVSGTSSKINFLGTAAAPVTINATGYGTLFMGTASDFSLGTKYTGMSNVIINMNSSDATLGNFQDVGNLNLATFNTSIQTMLGAKAVNGSIYKVTINGGNLSIDRSVDLDSSTDMYNYITDERIVNQIESGVTVSSIKGSGLKIGSNSLASTDTSYNQSGYRILGTLIVVGGTSQKAGAFTDFGIIDVTGTGTIILDKGIGAYGVNGSKITNAGSININGIPEAGGRNVGITGLALKLDSSATPALDTYGASVISTANAVDITNTGSISVSGDSGIGIYAENNRTGLNKDKVLVTNKGTITALGTKSAGIYVSGATLELGTNSNITVGDYGIGVQTVNSEIKITDNIAFSIGAFGVALGFEGNAPSVGMAGKTITVNHTASSLTAAGIGIYYKGDSTVSEQMTNKANLIIGVENTSVTDKVVGIYAQGLSNTQKAKVINEGTITTGKTDTAIYGIDTIIENKTTLTLEEGSTGIAVFNGLVSQNDGTAADQKIIVKKNATGIYAEQSDVHVNEPIDVTGDRGLGIYVSNNTASNTVQNNSIITLEASSSPLNSNIGIYLTTSQGDNKNTGTIEVKQNSTGVYNKNSVFKNDTSGLISVLDTSTGSQNIGIFAISKGNSTDKFSVSNLGTININGLSNIGIYAEKDASGGASELKLAGGTINVASSNPSGSDYAIGVYAKGDGLVIDELGAVNQTTGQTIGIYESGKSSIKGNGTLALLPDTTGIYLTNGAQADTGVLSVENKAPIGTAERAIGLYYNNTVNPGSGITNKMTVNITGSSNEAIGMLVEGSSVPFVNQGNITIGTAGGTNNSSVGIYLKALPDAVNNGTITLNSKTSFGIYAKGDSSKLINNGIINVIGESSVGFGIVEGGSLESIHRSGDITASGNKTAGIYVEKAKAANESTINAIAGGSTGSVGAIALGGEFRNASTGIINTNNVGIYGSNKMNGLTVEASSKITNEGTINVNIDNGIGVIISGAGGKFNQTAGTISSTKNTTIGAAIINGAEGEMAGGSIVSTGLTGKGVYIEGVLTGGTVSQESKFTFTSGSISVGENGVGIIGKDGGIITQANGDITVKDNSVGIYLDKNSSLNSGVLNFKYEPNNPANKGIGIYYEGDPSNISAKTNSTAVNVLSGTNVIDIYSKNISLTNTAAQTVLKDGIGIYAIVDSPRTSEVANSGTMTLNGENSIGIYASSGVTVKDLSGAMDETVNAKDKVGVYIQPGANITGNSNFTFDVDGGIGLYLEDYIDYAGTVNVDGTTYTDSMDHRTVGIYTNNITSLAKDMKANVNVNDIEGVGVYLNNSKIKYTGTMNLNANNPDGKNGIGMYISGTSAVDFYGTLEINGENNVGYYIENGSILNVDNGTININSNSGIFAYIINGSLIFNSGGTSHISGPGGVSAVVSGSAGEIINRITLGMGQNGFQAVDGAKVTNDTTGILKSATSDISVIAMSGSKQSTIINRGKIELTGNDSVGIYVNDSIASLENGSSISVGEKGTALFGQLTPDNGNLTVNVGTAASDNTAISLNGKKGIGMYLETDVNATGTSTLNLNGNLNITSSSEDSTGLYLKDIDTINGILKGNINLSGLSSTGIYIKGGSLVNQAQITVGDSTETDNSVGIYTEGNTTIQNSAQIQTGKSGIGLYSNDSVITTTGNVTVGEGGITAVSRGSTAVINYNTTGDVNVANNSTIGFIAEDSGTINLGGKTVNIGQNDSVGLIMRNNGKITGINGVNVSLDSTGVYMESVSGNYNINYNIALNGDKAWGFVAKHQEVTLNSSISSTSHNTLGISVMDGGSITNNGSISLSGSESVAIYGFNIGDVTNNSGKTITVGDSGVESSVGIFVEGGSNIVNQGDITTGAAAVGIYGKNITALIRNTGNILSASEKSAGIYGENTKIENTGTIKLGIAGVGIYGANTDINNTGKIITGDSETSLSGETAVGIYSTGTANVINNSDITVGKTAVGIFGENAAIVNNANITAGENSIYIFSYGSGGSIKNNSTLDLTDRSIGLYAVSGTVENSSSGVINTGRSKIDTEPKDFAVGMATETGTLINNGTVNVGKEIGVGMFAGKEGYNTGRVYNNGTINVTGRNAYGVQVTNGAKAYNTAGGVINVSGTGAFGMSASNSSMIYNDGTINISGGAMGIYLDDSYFENNGTMNMTKTDQGVYLAAGSTFVNNGNLYINGSGVSESDIQVESGSEFINVGKLTIGGPTVSLSGVPITNIGNIVIKGALNIPAGSNVILNTVNTDNGMGSWKILDGIQGSGNIVMTPGATQGNNQLIQNVQIMDLGTTTGDYLITSQSVSWLADKWYDSVSGKFVFRLIKIPYVELLSGTAAEEFGKGLDEIYEAAKGPELAMFDALDNITNKDLLAEKFDMELRGNTYSNIQNRMMDINDIFNSSYKYMKKDENPTKDTAKVTLIYNSGEGTDKNPGVIDYDYNSYGILYLKEKENITYGQIL
ncbi:MAG: autotransporter-associated N-terminal domain-containing protein, partial [Fusobacteriales bacterium]|nr:autotransporter-associated N-terminal domain-containing protein [Fusobacteriales bacterium]